MLPISIKPGLAVAAKASGVVGTEGMSGALAMAAFTSFSVGTIIREDCKIKHTGKGFKHHRTLHVLNNVSLDCIKQIGITFSLGDQLALCFLTTSSRHRCQLGLPTTLVS